MTADTPSLFVPKLRFPEFRDTPGWDRRRLGDALAFQAGFPFPSSNFNDGGIGLRLIRNRDLRSDDTIVFYSGSFDDAFLVHDGDVLIGMDGDFTPCVWAKGRALLNQRVGRIFARGTNALHFLRYFLDIHLQAIESTTARTTVKHLSHSEVEEIEHLLPLPAEQQKIAECLTSHDDLIAAEGRKLDALRRHKQGLMQQLFPQLGETVPRLRFPEFHNTTEWQERRAGSLFANRVAKGEEGLPIYSVTMYDGMVQRDTLDRNFHDIEDAASNKKVCNGDIAYNMMRMWQGALGVAVEDCLVSPAYVVLAPQKDVVSHFFAYLFKLPSSLQLLTSHSRGLTKDRLRLYYDDFARIPLRCPERVEQQRIADCLASLDANIAAEAEYLAALKRHEHGLLQQLFPAPEEESQ